MPSPALLAEPHKRRRKQGRFAVKVGFCADSLAKNQRLFDRGSSITTKVADVLGRHAWLVFR
jgi:hypothetical protein